MTLGSAMQSVPDRKRCAPAGRGFSGSGHMKRPETRHQVSSMTYRCIGESIGTQGMRRSSAHHTGGFLDAGADLRQKWSLRAGSQSHDCFQRVVGEVHHHLSQTPFIAGDRDTSARFRSTRMERCLASPSSRSSTRPTSEARSTACPINSRGRANSVEPWRAAGGARPAGPAWGG